MDNSGTLPMDEQFDYRAAGYAYMIRISDRDGYSSRGFKWPERGYVKPEAWSEDGREGLYGFLHGSGNYALPILLHEYYHTWQVVVVKEDRIRPGIGWGESRAPEGWVKYSGTIDNVFVSLRLENSKYATRVADNLSMCIQHMDDVLKGRVDAAWHDAEAMEKFRALPYRGETEEEHQHTFEVCLANLGLFAFFPEAHPHRYTGPDPW